MNHSIKKFLFPLLLCSIVGVNAQIKSALISPEGIIENLPDYKERAALYKTFADSLLKTWETPENKKLLELAQKDFPKPSENEDVYLLQRQIQEAQLKVKDMNERMQNQANRKIEQIFPEKGEIYEKSIAYAKENGIQLLFYYDKNGITTWRFFDNEAEKTLQQKMDACVKGGGELKGDAFNDQVNKCRSSTLDPLIKSAVNISETIFNMVK